MSYLPDIAIIAMLVLCNGFFAMAELAVVSSRRARLQVMVERRVRGAATALLLNQDPARFLSTVQVGITLIGIVAGVYGGDRLATPLEEYLATFPVLATYSEGLAITAVVTAIGYASIVMGELVPKQLAIRRAEHIATGIAPVMSLVAKVLVPLVFILEISSRAILALFGAHARPRTQVIDEELKALVTEGVQEGLMTPQEKDMISGVMRLADWKVRAIKTPAVYVEWLDLDAQDSEQRQRLMESAFSRLVVRRGNVNRPLGIVQTKDLLSQVLAGQPLNIEAAILAPIYVDDHTSTLRLLETFRRAPVHMAVVLDEAGNVSGVVTTFDILKAIVGGFTGAEELPGPQAFQRADGSWLIDGELHLDAVRDILGLPELAAGSDYHTLAGFMLERFEAIPATGDRFDWEGSRFEVVDMDGARIDKVLVSRLPAPNADE